MSSRNLTVQFLLCRSTPENVIKTKTTLSVINHGAIIFDRRVTRFLGLSQSAIHPDITTSFIGGIARFGCDAH